MTCYSKVFNLTNEIREKAIILPSPYVDYVVAELERLKKYEIAKLEQITKRKVKEK